MSESEEENYCFFGKPLEPYDEDAFPKKKPISMEDQIATDAQGRRRFHGAFTGGFSAGFFNTVGSLEGWTPSEFKSTRQEKAFSKSQKPEDFMDEEDIGEFGIAPQTVRATSDYSTSKKRRKQVFSDGPIPGEPVLHSLLTSGNETIGYLLLKNIGMKGKPNKLEEDKVYGCEMPKSYEISRDEYGQQYTIPDIYKEFLQNPKSNTFGLGYEGLDKSHVNLFQSASLVIQERNKKNVSIKGQAFGVGAFEDDDEDIYVKDDMSKYDFELTGEKSLKKKLQKNEKTVFDEFVRTKNLLPPRETFPPPTIPHSFTGKHKVKKSRFEPLPIENEPPPVERKEMNPEIRAKYLGEEIIATQPIQSTPRETSKKEILTPVTENESSSESHTKNFLSTGFISDRFVAASRPEDPHNILEVVEKSTTEHGTQEMRDAARMKMFGPLTRITIDWQPCSILCKRFNVPEPNFDLTTKNKKRTRTNLIFEYEQFNEATSSDFKPGLTTTANNQIIIESSTEKGNSQENPNTDSNTRQEQEEETQTKNITEIVEDTIGNIPKDITDKIDVDRNTDLFKAIFLSSSESEDDEDEKKDSNKEVEMKTSILSDNLLHKIKPIKEGILSNMDFSIFANTNDEHNYNEQSIHESNISSSNFSSTKDDGSYGPSLPQQLTKTLTPSFPILTKCSNDEDGKWVEKKDKRHKSSHKKKHKNKKSSHKKKHKHSRD